MDNPDGAVSTDTAAPSVSFVFMPKSLVSNESFDLGGCNG